MAPGLFFVRTSLGIRRLLPHAIDFLTRTGPVQHRCRQLVCRDCPRFISFLPVSSPFLFRSKPKQQYQALLHKRFQPNAAVTIATATAAAAASDGKISRTARRAVLLSFPLPSSLSSCPCSSLQNTKLLRSKKVLNPSLVAAEHSGVLSSAFPPLRQLPPRISSQIATRKSA